MKLISFLIMCMLVSVNLSAQIDSTFVRYYYPTTQTLPSWESFPISQTMAANVFEDYEGKFVLQALATFHSPPPEWVFPQSPMMLYSRSGGYQNTVFGPQFGGDIVEGYYSRIVKDGLGGYLPLDSHYNRLQRLDANLQFVELVHLTYNQGLINYIDDILPVDNDFIIIGHIQETNDALFCKVDYSLDIIWQYQSPANVNATIESTSDGSILFNWGFNPTMRLMKITADGDSLWTIEYPPRPCVERIIESNGNYFGLRYNDNVVDGLLMVYDYGVDFCNLNPETPILTIPTYRLLDEEIVFPAIRTNDNNIILAVSTPIGEIFKFDSAFNMLWSSNALPIERIGVGKHSLQELDNGDILYCATVIELPRRLGLVRVDSNGNYVGVSDETEHTPPIRCISAYPNPFSRKITLSTNRQLLHPSKLTIYNIKGQQVESIDLNDKAVTWVPKDIPSGLYIVKLATDSKTIETHLISYIK
ncbi:MAG: T9SS type A sorting domain-containing protein [Candidatus Syntrophosphaera sp.]|nr:T9SS type A sorting domain-containing protein [Candidatus Cloacimonadota bacterium]MDY0112129.1 T9SS type A sorting domain-containing protein [Candidatus Syntrophosphaera sp.]